MAPPELSELHANLPVALTQPNVPDSPQSPAKLKTKPWRAETEAMLAEMEPTVYRSPEIKTSLEVVIQLDSGKSARLVPNLL